ncbi:NADH:ubiquinone oxidoreductase 11.6kD subunit [Ophiocordyceps camponoti-floridani]|uniref:NADH dehydrogenase [ubiquinone] 1 beta subcomplex subunit 11, mitochondrial n=1 Tax=Ophiocordyceps camponoti-floridani TaxID=2030778 RepID=A0A8H4VH41_9HYPO|nr:NADH:ubiquinone oxidoreductase 11.6kD subunit [Ophiocordyceps camponoti-floridani]
MALLIRRAHLPLRAVRCLRQPPASSRSFALSSRRLGGGHSNESQFDPPSGWLWGIKPGEKPEPEGWEWPFYLFAGSLIATGVIWAYKPDTSVSTWALEEARRRLEAEGILPDPSPTQPQEKK